MRVTRTRTRTASGTAPLYVNNTTLGARVASLNPRWNQPSDDATLYQQVRLGVRGRVGGGGCRCGCGGVWAGAGAYAGAGECGRGRVQVRGRGSVGGGGGGGEWEGAGAGVGAGEGECGRDAAFHCS